MPWRYSRLLLLCILGIALVYILSTIVSGIYLYRKTYSPQEATYTSFIPYPQEHIRWKSSSPITLVNYISFDCEHCRELFLYEEGMGDLFRNSFSLVYRNSPLAFQPLSGEKALLAECVYNQGGDVAYFAFIKDMFTNYKTNEQNNEWVISLASQHVPNYELFLTCKEDSVMKEKIQQHKNEALGYGVYGTPTIQVIENNLIIKQFNTISATTAKRIYLIFKKNELK